LAAAVAEADATARAVVLGPPCAGAADCIVRSAVVGAAGVGTGGAAVGAACSPRRAAGRADAARGTAFTAAVALACGSAGAVVLRQSDIGAAHIAVGGAVVGAA